MKSRWKELRYNKCMLRLADFGGSWFFESVGFGRPCSYFLPNKSSSVDEKLLASPPPVNSHRPRRPQHCQAPCHVQARPDDI